MQRIVFSAISGIALTVSVVALGVAWVSAQSRSPSPSRLAPPVVAYQGFLTDAQGVPVVDETRPITFTIYDAETGGTPLWTETRTVATVNGVFTVLLGEIKSLDDGTVENPPVYLGVKVGAESEMAPRQFLASVPFALRARMAERATVADDASALNGKEASAFARADHTHDD